MTKTFLVELQTARLFDEGDLLEQRFGVSRLEPGAEFSPYVSTPERAVLEMLAMVPEKQSLEEAKEMMEGMFALNPKRMGTLLSRCHRAKIKRLFLTVAKELALPVINPSRQST